MLQELSDRVGPFFSAVARGGPQRRAGAGTSEPDVTRPSRSGSRGTTSIR